MSNTTSPEKIAVPVNILTGFLGSGKTTLLNRLLNDPAQKEAMGETAILINELGDVAIDHLLVEQITEALVLLENGCVCCSVRGDLARAMRDLLAHRAAGTIPAFERLIIETTGLADPAPVIHTLISDTLCASNFRLDAIITTVDATLGASTLDDHEEAVKQVAVADRIVLTKTDLASPETRETLTQRLSALNPVAGSRLLDSAATGCADLFDAGLFDGHHEARVEAWLALEYVPAHGGAVSHLHDGAVSHLHDGAVSHLHDGAVSHLHDKAIRTFTLEGTAPINRDAFVEWLEMLLTTQGERILRVKGVLAVEGEALPIAIHGVQHVFYPPVELKNWPDGWQAGRTSKLVFITRNLGAGAVRDTLNAFLPGVLVDAK